MHNENAVAVVDQSADRTVVWWIRLEVGETQRLRGAWVFDPEDSRTLYALVADRSVVATAEGAAALNSARIDYWALDPADVTGGVVDAWEAICLEYELANARRVSGRPLAALRKPQLPRLIDLVEPPPSPALPVAPRAFLIARDLDAWCTAWSEIERERLSRPFMRETFGGEVRQMPGLAVLAAVRVAADGLHGSPLIAAQRGVSDHAGRSRAPIG